MADRENVIHSLECCFDVQSGWKDAVWVCPACPYAKNDGQPCETLAPLLDDAITLLKAQRPRVMTLEEVRNNVGIPAWFESHGTFRGKKGFWVLLGETDAGLFTKKLMCAIGMTSTELGLSAYGEVWRCWTFQPTTKQMEETLWK